MQRDLNYFPFVFCHSATYTDMKDKTLTLRTELKGLQWGKTTERLEGIDTLTYYHPYFQGQNDDARGTRDSYLPVDADTLYFHVYYYL